MQGDDQNVFTKLGPYAWLAGAVLSTEVLIIVKFGRDEFTAPFPERIKVAWSIFGAAMAALLVVWQVALWVAQFRRRASPPGARKKVA